MKKVTKKQVILLFVAICGLIISIFAMYIALPMMSKMGEIDEEYETAEGKLTAMKTDASLLGIYLEEGQESSAKLKEALEKFNEIKSNAWIDNYFLSLLEKNGCMASGLGIEDAVPIEESSYFTSLGTSDATIDDEVTEGSETDNNDEFASTTVSSSGLYVISANYQITTSYANLLKTIAALKAENSVAIGRLTFDQTINETISGGTTEVYSPVTGMSVTNGDNIEIKHELGEELDCQISLLMIAHPPIDSIIPATPSEEDGDSESEDVENYETENE